MRKFVCSAKVKTTDRLIASTLLLVVSKVGYCLIDYCYVVVGLITLTVWLWRAFGKEVRLRKVFCVSRLSNSIYVLSLISGVKVVLSVVVPHPCTWFIERSSHVKETLVSIQDYHITFMQEMSYALFHLHWIFNFFWNVKKCKKKILFCVFIGPTSH
jgi:hypothetical protein